MNPVRTEKYKGFEIRIYVWRDVRKSDGYLGMYEICSGQNRANRGVLSGGFVVAHEAEQAALERAMLWLDDQRQVDRGST